MSVLEVKDLMKSFGKTRVLKGVSFNLEEGEVLSIIGSSGSGKTTLMNILGALDRQTSGTLLFEGQDIGELSDKKRELIRRKDIGFVFQFHWVGAGGGGHTPEAHRIFNFHFSILNSSSVSPTSARDATLKLSTPSPMPSAPACPLWSV